MKNFSDLYSRYYDLLYSDKNYKEEVDYMNSFLKRYNSIPNNNLLDVGCGSGKHLKYFSELGYNIFGVDISSDMIEKAKINLRMCGRGGGNCFKC